MALNINLDLDPTFRSALKLLHSPAPDSAEKIRNALDETIKSRYGGSKMLANTLNKKILSEEASFPGTRVVRVKSVEAKQSPTPVETMQIDDSSSDTVHVQQQPTIVMEINSDNDSDNEPIIEEDHLKELEDLMCIVCRRIIMDTNVRNRLVECVDCHSLYHQDCHKPIISENEANDSNWHCTMCKTNKAAIASATPPSSAATTPTPSSKPSSSSHSSSSHHHKSSSKNYESSSSSSSSESRKSKTPSSPTPSKSKSSSSSSKERKSDSHSSSRESREERSERSNSESKSGSGSTSKSSVTPNINIISADKRLQIMKKKAAKLHETKRKHK